MGSESHYRHSVLRERIVEHVFVGDALRSLWRIGVTDVEVLRSEFDAYGYDLVMGRGDIVRHVQFKTGTSKPRRISVALALGEKPSGCVIFIQITPRLDLGPFFWFGAEPGVKLPSIIDCPNPSRTTPNRDGEYPARQNHRELPGIAFTKLNTLSDVLVRLFGQLPSEAEA